MSYTFVVYCRPPVEGLAARMTLLQLSLSSADLAASLIRGPVQSLMSSFHRLLGRPLPLLPGTQPCMMSFSKQFAFLIIRGHTLVCSMYVSSCSTPSIFQSCKFSYPHLAFKRSMIGLLSSGGACFPPRWCELRVAPPPVRNVRTVRVDHFSYPTHSR